MITLSTIPNSSCSRHGNNGNERKREGGPVLDSITTGEKSYFLAVRSRLRKTNKATHRFNPLQIVRIR